MVELVAHERVFEVGYASLLLVVRDVHTSWKSLNAHFFAASDKRDTFLIQRAWVRVKRAFSCWLGHVTAVVSF